MDLYNIPLSDAFAPEDTDGSVTLWCVSPHSLWFPSKIAAIVFARRSYPSEDVSQREARIYFKQFFKVPS